MKRFVVFDLYLFEYFIIVYTICTKLRSSSIEMNLIIHCAKFFWFFFLVDIWTAVTLSLEFWCPISLVAESNVHSLTYLKLDIAITILEFILYEQYPRVEVHKITRQEILLLECFWNFIHTRKMRLSAFQNYAVWLANLTIIYTRALIYPNLTL